MTPIENMLIIFGYGFLAGVLIEYITQPLVNYPSIRHGVKTGFEFMILEPSVPKLF